MTQGAPSLHLLGSKVSANNSMALDVNATNAVQHLKQEVIRLQTENKKLTDQLNCFISLVQRSWKGDKYATTHLSNIIGLDAPKENPANNDGIQARPNSQIDAKTRSQCNWERLAKRLLDREYQAVQEEIREYQQKYIENRQLYMDAVLHDHHQSMSVIPLSRTSHKSHDVENVDARFIKHNKAIERMGMSHRQHRRAQSAKIKRKLSAQDQVQAMDICLKDLVGETPSSSHFSTAEASTDPYTITPSQHLKARPQSSFVRRPPPNTYNDPNRYAQGDLYGLKDTDGLRKPRPVSASSLRDGDNARSRPRAVSIDKIGSSTFITQKNERSLKYEATKPIYVRPKSSKARVKSAGHDPSSILKRSNSHTGLSSQTDVISASSANVSAPYWHANGYDPKPELSKQDGGMPNVEESPGCYPDRKTDKNLTGNEDGELPPKPAISVKVKSAFARRPAHIDKFAEEEKQMRELEEDFKKTALGLQKKLGIEDRGMVIL